MELNENFKLFELIQKWMVQARPLKIDKDGGEGEREGEREREREIGNKQYTHAWPCSVLLYVEPRERIQLPVEQNQ